MDGTWANFGAYVEKGADLGFILLITFLKMARWRDIFTNYIGNNSWILKKYGNVMWFHKGTLQRAMLVLSKIIFIFTSVVVAICGSVVQKKLNVTCVR